MIDHIFQGFNATLMVYGQTTSGKTFTVIGEDGDQTGFVSRSVYKYIYLYLK